MIKINVKLDNGAAIPKKANDLDTGYDLVSITEPKIVGNQFGISPLGKLWSSIDYIEYGTGIKLGNLKLQEDEVEVPIYTLLFPRSSVSKYNLSLANCIGLVDNPYRGELMLRFNYIFQPEDLVIEEKRVFGRVNLDKIYKKGDKVAQLVPMLLLPSIEFNVVSELDTTKRADGGFGSTGK
jgi:dUTP pyrophosphatase